MDKRMQVGGQAVLEGVMMRGPTSFVVAVRRPDGEISTMSEKLAGLGQKWPKSKLFPLRGIIALVDTFALGLKALSFSAKEATGEEETFGTKELIISFTFALIFVVGLFVILPVFFSSLTERATSSSYLKSLFEGLLRVALFVGYIVVVAQIKDIKRVFQYHGAEHKVVHAYEAGQSLTQDNINRHSPLHVGCGTAYLMMVMIIAILVFAFIPKTSLPIRIAIQIILIPVIASISYEITKMARRHESSRLVRIAMAPGLLLQKLTAKEPDKGQIEVAIAALEKVVELEDEQSSEANKPESEKISKDPGNGDPGQKPEEPDEVIYKIKYTIDEGNENDSSTEP